VKAVRYALIILFSIYFVLIFFDIIMAKPIPYLWRYGLHGMLGVLFGVIFFSYQDKALSNKFIKCLELISLSIFLIMISVASVRDSIYEYFLLNLGIDSFAAAFYLIGFGTIFFLHYDLGKKSLVWLAKSIKILGKYSLFVYLSQIIIINLILILFRGFKLDKQWKCLMFSVIIAFFCYVLTKMVNRGRKDYRSVNKLYRVIFQ